MGKPFQPGADPRRNLKGRGKCKPSIPDILRRIGSRRLPAELKGRLPDDIRSSKTMLEALMLVTYARAIQGESWAVQFIADRTEGKVKETLAIEGGQTLAIVEELVDAGATVV